MLIKPKFASLTAGLLARKGEAHPAATTELTDELTRGTYSHYASEDEHGEPPRHQAPPEPVEQQQRIVRAFEPPEPVRRETRRREPVFTEPVFTEPVFTEPTLPEPAPVASLLSTVAYTETPLRDHAPPADSTTRSSPAPETSQVKTETESEKRCPTCTPEAQDDRRFHVSVRLKRGRYLRLKLAAASLHKPSQDIIGEALDAYFAKLGPEVLGDCPCLYR